MDASDSHVLAGFSMMETRMSMSERFLALAGQQLKALDVLYREHLTMPYLAIFYSTIDVFAFIWQGGQDKFAGTRFRCFADKYLLKHLKGLSAYDLWGARCAILHTGSPDSTSSKEGKARRLAYAWGKAPVAVLEQVITGSAHPETCAAVTLESLEGALRQGLAEFLADLKRDKTLCSSCEPRLDQVYSNIDLHPVELTER